MAEPTSTAGGAGIVAVSVALLGPMAGEYAVIVLSALAGALWALSRVETATRTQGAMLVARLVLTAVVLTGGLAWYVQSEYQVAAQQVVAPIAFGIGFLGDRWGKLADSLLQGLRRRFLGETTDGGAK